MQANYTLMKWTHATLLIVLGASVFSMVRAESTVVTIKPIYALVVGITGKTQKTKLLVSGNKSPHYFHLTPSKRLTLEQAQTLIYIDCNFETFIGDVLATLPKRLHQIGLLTSVPKLNILPSRELNAKTDPHVWLDPNNAKHIVQYLVQVFSEELPQRRAFYEERGTRLRQRLETLDRDIRQKLAGLPPQIPFMVLHDGFQYFETHYGYMPKRVVDLTHKSAITPEQLQSLRQWLKQTNTRCIFGTPKISKRLIQTLTEGTQANYITLDPLGVNLAANEDAYFIMMNTLAENFISCLAAADIAL